ncbi:MAG: class I SAM-dependent methyltransferase [Patescibacteria group bacterium]|nr:class I SAM-dependent methyltransferase [Patescibacteria group bacterium]
MGPIGAFMTSRLEKADIMVNKPGTYAIRVRDPKLYGRVARSGTVAVGEGYMERAWECTNLIDTLAHGIEAQFHRRLGGIVNRAAQLAWRLYDEQTLVKARRVAEVHYNLGNDLYEVMLGTSMTYTCAYWCAGINSLEAAQAEKYERICRKIGLDKRTRGTAVLDIGCGWGGFAAYASERYGAHVVGISLAEEQIRHARERYADNPNVEFHVMDYRDVPNFYGREAFDAIVSIGMFEHVGPSHYAEYFSVVDDVLKTGGIAFLHTIGGRGGNDRWINKYIFPGGYIPSEKQIRRAYEGRFIRLDLEEFGYFYYLTLKAWLENFEEAWPKLERKYGHMQNGQFYRMWEFYLASCAAGFLSGELKLYQFVLSRCARPDYEPIRADYPLSLGVSI